LAEPPDDVAAVHQHGANRDYSLREPLLGFFNGYVKKVTHWRAIIAATAVEAKKVRISSFGASKWRKCRKTMTREAQQLDCRRAL
jgi:hypothetical protein